MTAQQTFPSEQKHGQARHQPAPGRAVENPRRDPHPEHARNLRGSRGGRTLPSAVECLPVLRPFLDQDGVFLQLDGSGSHLARLVAAQVRFAYGLHPGSPAPDADEVRTNFEWLHATPTYIPLGDDRVSVAFSDRLFERLGSVELSRHLREISRILVPGGVYVCRTTHRYALPQVGRRHPDGGAPEGQPRAGTFGELAERLHAAGFAEVGVRARVRGWSVAFPSWVVRAVEAALRWLPGRVRGWVCCSAPLRPLLGTLTLIAWKDPGCYLRDAHPAYRPGIA